MGWEVRNGTLYYYVKSIEEGRVKSGYMGTGDLAQAMGYLRALEMLARVRRLELPAVQVNIGARQVNQLVTGLASPPTLPLRGTDAPLPGEGRQRRRQRLPAAEPE